MTSTSSRIYRHIYQIALGAVVFLGSPALAQAPAGPPVGDCVVAEKKQGTQIQQFIRRVEVVNKVNVIARDSAELQEAPFKEGTEVKKGDILYQLEKPP